MTLSPKTSYLEKLLFIALLGLPIGGLSVVEAGGRDPLFPGAVRPGLDYRTELAQGYLVVYSDSDRVDDGGVQYYPHSSYVIRTLDGKLFKNVENHVSSSDETPELVVLPVGIYVVEARSSKEGYLRVHVSIRPGLKAVLDLDGEQADIQKRLTRAKHSRSQAEG